MATQLIDAGRLSTELVLESPSAEADDYGGLSGAWSQVATVWAALEPISPVTLLWAGQSLDEATHRISIRFRDGVKAGMRFRKDGRAFVVKSVTDPDETARYLVCLTREEK